MRPVARPARLKPIATPAGPWKAMQIDRPTPAQRRRLADQQWVFAAHQDHLHVAR